ncbi:uncharacterized protein LOC131692283 [Topomyia yanbarensis]|uniref:uncharacterized protein LOC131692283 n=1 Tax=Topomyia yanbarensis TaxID=2498891 RepID=UPI00273C8249|nr:uncharacterized protein LOC131692283 [Topomyia yanbarensis]XP_058835226.1 uncharacterized protein LOC131692283 [Topomyia yanbarensis]
MSTSDFESAASVGTESEEFHATNSMPDADRSLAQRMLLYVYNRAGITHARQLMFWEDFRSSNPDVEMQARDLRAMFFEEVLNDLEHYDDLAYEVVQYLNPIFNQYQRGVLEFGDLAEGEDFLLNVPPGVAGGELSFEEMVNYVSAPITASRNLPMVPLNLELVTTPRSKRPSREDEMAQQFAKLLSELVWTEEEAAEKPVLPIPELRERTFALTKAGISLQHLLEPGMIAHTLLSQQYEARAEKAAECDQVVPATCASSGKRSAAKRCQSYDDSGLGLSPSKRALLMTPMLPSARRLEQHHRLRRLVSAPPEC